MKHQHKQRRPLGKRARFFIVFIFIGVLFIFTAAIFLFNDKYTDEKQGLDVSIGKKSTDLFRTYQAGEELQFTLASTAKYAVFEAALPLGRNGGFLSVSPCGTYAGLNLWNREKTSCLRSPPGQALAAYLAPRLQADIDQAFPDTIPAKTFHLYADQDRVMGVSSQDIRMGLSGQPLNEYLIPQDQGNMIRKVSLLYKETVDEQLKKQSRGLANSSEILALIAASSRGDPLHIDEDLGCAGIIPICYSLITAHPSFIENIVPCDCQGEQCRTQAKCTPHNDDRFEPEKSIAWAIGRFEDDLQMFSRYAAGEELAYAAMVSGQQLVLQAVKLTGEQDPSFRSVGRYITPALIEDYYQGYIDAGYLQTRAELIRKSQQIRRFATQAKEAREYVDRLIAEATKNKPTSNVEDITG
ncbi:MAG: hypothetical protein GXP63_02600, partial [DPANN group archaeon]|nr:hypothetical protein [DPANN group archaeon]